MSYDWCWVYENPKEAAAALDDYSTWHDRHKAEIETLRSQLAKCQKELEETRRVVVTLNEYLLRERQTTGGPRWSGTPPA